LLATQSGNFWIHPDIIQTNDLFTFKFVIVILNIANIRRNPLFMHD